ncbi:hypothetical protein BY458DRAFT_324029 [Sporodiniella umbellata]|nr:hypothetical protein BY458DRAFT_324029 [Sporodiniella umbellata]
MDRFADPPRTLFDEIGDHNPFITIKSVDERIEEDWNQVVFQLQEQNESLLQSLKETSQELLKYKKENELLTAQTQKQHHELLQRDRDQSRQFNNRVLELKNCHLKESQSQLFRHNENQNFTLTRKNRLRSIVYALIAVQRFYKTLLNL